MKRLLILLLVLLLLAVPVSAVESLVQDGEGLLTDTDIVRLEEYYSTFYDAYGFTPAVATVGNFGGLTIEEFAGSYYDVMEYPDDGMLLMVSLEEGQWYILTNGECYHRISDWDAQRIGDELVPMFQDGAFYAAFLQFPDLAAEIFQANDSIWEEDQESVEVAPATLKKNYGKTIAISMVVGLVLGFLVVGVMAAMMKTVQRQDHAKDYICPGSMKLTNSRDIYLYSHVSRTPKPKSNSTSGGSYSGGGHSSGGRSGGSRGGAGGRF